MFNLCALGSLAILFWALVIRYSTLPELTSMAPSILESSARVIPGIPEPNLPKFPDWIKVATSITAWMIFVLYAGPVASLFPVLQDRFVKQTSDLYGRLRVARRTLYAPAYHLNILVQQMREHPELQALINCIFYFKVHPDLNKLFRDEPDSARILKERPDLVKILVDAGIAIPNLDEFIPTEADGSCIDPRTALSTSTCAPSEKLPDQTIKSGSEIDPAEEPPNTAKEPSTGDDSPLMPENGNENR
jgi:hypothetical protein